MLNLFNFSRVDPDEIILAFSLLSVIKLSLTFSRYNLDGVDITLEWILNDVLKFEEWLFFLKLCNNFYLCFSS